MTALKVTGKDTSKCHLDPVQKGKKKILLVIHKQGFYYHKQNCQNLISVVL